MKKVFILLLCFYALGYVPTTLAFKRIKREAVRENNRSNISNDFVVVHTNSDKPLKANNKTDIKGGENSLYVTIEDKATNSIEDTGHIVDFQEANSMNKQGLVPAPTYIWRRREHQLEEGNNSSSARKDKPVESSLAEDASSTNKESSTHVLSDAFNLSPFASGTANIRGAHVILPSKSLAYSPLSSFSPIDQMIRYANMLLYKVGGDSMTPNLQHNMMSPLRPTSQPQDVTAGTKDMLNSLELTQSQTHHTPLSDKVPLNSNINKGQSGRIIYTSPWYFQNPDGTKEPGALKDILKNSLDNGPNEMETTLLCPLHYNDKSAVDSQYGPFEADAMDNKGLIQVCSCRWINTNKDLSNKKHK